MLHTTPDPGPFNTRYRRVLAPLPWQTMGVKAFFRLFLKSLTQDYYFLSVLKHVFHKAGQQLHYNDWDLPAVY